MSLVARYQEFLARPSADALAENASINYITTLTTINGPAAIIKHLAAQARQLEKKRENVLSSIESGNGLCLDVETTIEFTSGGGAILPGLDDNFLADRTVVFPLVHIVTFDPDHKISQIRIYWDQGSLLKQVDIIGARARNWPIRDGKDMIRLISSSAANAGKDQPGAPPATEETASTTRSTRGPSISSKRSSVSATGDRHASLSLFEGRPSTPPAEFKTTVSPRPSAKPAPRGLAEILATDNEDDVDTPGPAARGTSPAKGPHIKAGAGKNFRPNRLFDETDETPTQSPEKTNTKLNPKKFNHFEFGHGEDAGEITARPTSKSGKHQSQWDFEDFVTPQKIAPKVRGQDVRHFGWSDDEDTESPVRRPVVHQPRPDAKAHFEFVDDGTPDDKKAAPSKKGLAHNKGLGLYKDHILGDEETPAAKKPLANVTGHAINNENRRKDFASKWEMADQSPTTARPPIEKNLSEDKKKVLNGLDAHWSLFDESPDAGKKENVPGSRGIKTSGNGMGGRKGAAPQWGFGDGEEEETTTTNRGRNQKPVDKSFWDF